MCECWLRAVTVAIVLTLSAADAFAKPQARQLAERGDAGEALVIREMVEDSDGDSAVTEENGPAPSVSPAARFDAPSDTGTAPAQAATPEPAPEKVAPAADPAGDPQPNAAQPFDPDETAPVAQPFAEPGKRAARPEDTTLTVATWESAYNAAQKRVLLEPFAAETRHTLQTVSHGGDMDGLTAARAEAGGWDLIELNAQAAQRGCAQGWLERIAVDDLPASVEGEPARADYLPGAVKPCAVASAAWSAVMVYDDRAAFAQAPSGLADLFDLQDFPGKRTLPRQAPYVLEMALMSDGVAPGDVYERLATRVGQDRAFAKLSSIRHAIVWWDDAARALDAFSAEAPETVADVVMGVAFNGRVFNSAIRARQYLRLIWDGQVYQFNYWAIPKSARSQEAAKRLLRYVSMPERQAQLTRLFPYGPVRRSALPLVGQHAEIDLDMAAFVPTMPRHMDTALRFDAAWWAAHGGPIKARFAEWLDLPTPQVPADQLVPPTPVQSLRAQAMTLQ